VRIEEVEKYVGLTGELSNPERLRIYISERRHNGHIE